MQQNNNNSASGTNLAAADQQQQPLQPAASSDDLNHSNSNHGIHAGNDDHMSIKERLGNPKITFVLGKYSQPIKKLQRHTSFEGVGGTVLTFVIYRWASLRQGHSVREAR
jgi:hypothetical protein